MADRAAFELGEIPSPAPHPESAAAPVNPDHRDYVDNVYAHSERSSATHFVTGDHLLEYEAYLRKALDSDPAVSGDLHCPTFATLHDFSAGVDNGPTPLQTPADVDALKSEDAAEAVQSQLIFLRGHPSPRWLVAVGAAFDIDHSFFYDHISSFGRKEQQAPPSRPGLPSKFSSQFCVRLTSLGRASRPHLVTGDGAEELRRVRQGCRKMMADHFSRVKEEQAHLGASVVRRYSIHSASKFSLEQEISVMVKSTPGGWLAVAFMDIGENIARSPCGESMSAPIDGNGDNTLWLPTLRQYDQAEHPLQNPGHGGNPDDGGIQQNIRMLAPQYGWTLDPRLARLSAFYAVSELFDIVATNESEFLNTVRDVIKEDLEVAIDAWDNFGQSTVSFSNLLHNQQTLMEHIERLRDNLAAIESWEKWPAHKSFADDESARSAVQTEAMRLAKDFQCLIRRARSLIKRCDRGSRTVVSIASMQDSQRSLEQAKKVENLSRLAFVFLPVTFVSGFFGMNFEVFGQGQLSLWIFAAVAGPILAIVIVVMSKRSRDQVERQAKKLSSMLKRRKLATTPSSPV